MRAHDYGNGVLYVEDNGEWISARGDGFPTSSAGRVPNGMIAWRNDFKAFYQWDRTAGWLIVGGGPGGGGVAISAGAQSTGSGTVIFSNANGVSFGLDAGTLTASIAAGGAPGSLSAGTASVALGQVVFSNSNGVSFGLDGSTVTATVKTDYLTTAMASNRGSDFVQASAAFAGTSASGTIASNGISVSVGPYITTGALSNHSHGNPTLNLTNLSGTTGSNSAGFTLSLSAGNYLTTARASTDAVGLNTAATSVTWTVNSSGISLNAGAYLTTARASTDAVGLNTAQTNVTWTINSSGLSLNAGGYAGTASGFTGANISATMTHNTAGLSLSLSVAAPGAAAEANWVNLGGNTAGGSTASGSTIKWYGGANITLQATNGSEVSIVGGAGGAAVTLASFEPHVLGNSTTINSAGGQNSLWLMPFQLSLPVSGSSIIAALMSYSGTITSAATAQNGQTLQAALWSQNATDSTRFDTIWTGGLSMTFWNSGTSSYSYAYSGSGGNSTGSSAGSNLGTASVMGVRIHSMVLNSTLSAGVYLFGVLQSSSSAGYSAAMSRNALYMDMPASIGMGSIGGDTNTSVGFVWAGKYSTTTGALPASVGKAQIVPVANLRPYFKVGSV